MIIKAAVHTNGKYTVFFNGQANAYRPFTVVNTGTGKVEFAYGSLAVCLDYISDNT